MKPLMFLLCRYKREAYRGSEFAASVLASHDIPVVLKASRTTVDDPPFFGVLMSFCSIVIAVGP